MLLRVKKIILLSFLILLISGISIGIKMWYEPHKDVKGAKTIPVTAEALYNSYTFDSAKAKTIYENKILAISGEVKQVSLNQQNEQIILLKTNVDGGNINFTMEENIANPKPGSIITLKGICSGYIGGDAEMELPGDVFMIRCYLVSIN